MSDKGPGLCIFNKQPCFHKCSEKLGRAVSPLPELWLGISYVGQPQLGTEVQTGLVWLKVGGKSVLGWFVQASGSLMELWRPTWLKSGTEGIRSNFWLFTKCKLPDPSSFPWAWEAGIGWPIQIFKSKYLRWRVEGWNLFSCVRGGPSAINFYSPSGT